MDQKVTSPASDKKQGKLKRNLTVFEATMYSITFVIGTGIFMKPAVVLVNTGSTAMAMLIWLIGGVISLCSALTIAEIAAHIPRVGGLYTYLVEIYGDFVGGIYGWIAVLISGPGSFAAAAIAFATFSSYFIKMNAFQLRMLALGAIVFCVITQVISTKFSMQLQAIGTIAKLVPIFAIVFVGIFKGNIPGSINFDLVGGSPTGGIAVALLGVLWSFDGWQATCTLGDEMIKPEKNLPKSIILSLSFVTVVYIAFNYVIFRTASDSAILASTNSSVGVEVAKILFGPAGATLVAIGMILSAITSLNAQIAAPTRYLLAVANRRQIIGARFFSHINEKYDTPIRCLIMVIATIYIFTGTFNSVTDLVIFMIWIFFVLCVVGIFKMRKTRKSDDNLYHVPLFPIIPIIGALGGGYLVVATVMESPKTALIGAVVALAGIPMLIYCKKKYADDLKDENRG